jgi:glycerol-3-phosphate acyltransferase PlsY
MLFSLIAVLSASYLVGSIPTSIIVGKILRGRDFDIRKEGSGNAGGTNVFRVLGWKPGITVMAIDVLKGVLATLLISQWKPFGHIPPNDTVLQILAGLAAVCGHVWTIFAGFRGGKGVGTAGGMIIALYPIAALICFLIFIIVVFFTRYVSLGSIIAAVSLPILISLWPPPPPRDAEALIAFSLLVSGLIIYTHRSNIRRLLSGTENRFGKSREPASM